MTIAVGGSDANLMEVLIKKECIVRLCALDRGGTLSHIHMQG
jgi:hypothetical protein